MNQKNIAVLFGGCSSEYEVSLQSAHAVLTHLDPDYFHVIPIGITQSGEWYHFFGSPDALLNDSWASNPATLRPAILSPNRETGGMIAFTPEGNRITKIDLALPVLHGKNGEDGTIQGLLELAGIPIAGCGTLSSALCMDKGRAHQLVEAAGIPVPRSVTAVKPVRSQELYALTEDLDYPLFVKPLKAGSSLGISKIFCRKELVPAVLLALRQDDQVIIEETVPGFEVGCAILGNETLTVGRVDEIELTDGFFDYTEKYTQKTSRIYMPARIEADLELAIQETGKQIYRILGCSGFARVDLFLTPKHEILFNEVNTIPGFTSHSRYPNMMKGIGLDFSRLLHLILEGGVPA